VWCNRNSLNRFAPTFRSWIKISGKKLFGALAPRFFSVTRRLRGQSFFHHPVSKSRQGPLCTTLVSAFAVLIHTTLLHGQPLDTVAAVDQPSIRRIDRIRIAEAFALGKAIGPEIWNGWENPPFALLLVTHDLEFLIRHPSPSNDFTFLQFDSLLNADIFYRRREYTTNLLATFPAVKGISTIVIGQAESTEARTSTPWILTLMHEHFHQMQTTDPTYYTDVRTLDLSKGDNTGMWMLNYPFPYDSKTINDEFLLLSRKLREAVRYSGEPILQVKLDHYLALRNSFKSRLSNDDFKYLSFQLWQEGIARYTELKIAEAAADHHTPSEEFQSLKDFTSFGREARRIRLSILGSLWSLSLNTSKRSAFYPFGAAEGLLLDSVNPLWRKRYFTEKFFIERYFER